jgi:hypothetical protein
MQKIKPVAIWLLAAFLAFSSGALRAADNELPSTGQLLERVNALQQSIAELEDSGLINHGRATSLSTKLDKVTRALTSLTSTEGAGDVSALQVSNFLKELGKAIDALLDFISELTELVTELPAEVVQPIIDAAIALLRDLLGLLLG